MSHHKLPHLKNNTGFKEMYSSSKKFMCKGAESPFDHPHVYLDMGNNNEKRCPYCSTLYCFEDKKL